MAHTDFEKLGAYSPERLDPNTSATQPYVTKSYEVSTYERPMFSDEAIQQELLSPVVEEKLPSKLSRWKVIAAIGAATIAGLIAGQESASPVLKAEEGDTPTATTPEQAEATVQPTGEDPVLNIEMVEPEAEKPKPKPKPKPKMPWKYAYSKPSHGPLSKKLQRELNAITPSMYRQFIKIGNNCEGRRGGWRRDNGAFGGGLNITDRNWASDQYGGKDFARKAELATPAEQMVVMMRIQTSFGWGVPNWCPLASYGPWKNSYRIFKNH